MQPNAKQLYSNLHTLYHLFTLHILARMRELCAKPKHFPHQHPDEHASTKNFNVFSTEIYYRLILGVPSKTLQCLFSCSL